MALTFIPNSAPCYLALSTDVSGSKITGASYVGATVYLSDTKLTYVVMPDLTLVEVPTIDIGSVTVTNYSGSVVVSGSTTLNATENHIGQVGGKLTSGSVEFTNTSGSQTAYSIGDVVSGGSSVITPYEITNLFRIPGGSGYVVAAAISTDKSSITPNFNIHFYSASTVTIAGDNLPFIDYYTDTPYKLRPFTMNAMTSATNTSGSCSRTWDTTTIRQPVIARAGSTSLWVALETLAAFTPAATSEKFTISLIIDNN